MFQADLVKCVFQNVATNTCFRILEIYAKIYTQKRIVLLINEYDEKFLNHLCCRKMIPTKIQNGNKLFSANIVTFPPIGSPS